MQGSITLEPLPLAVKENYYARKLSPQLLADPGYRIWGRKCHPMDGWKVSRLLCALARKTRIPRLAAILRNCPCGLRPSGGSLCHHWNCDQKPS